MDFVFIAFITFSIAAVAAAVAVISVRNPVHSALSLVLTFFSVACVWIVGGAEFLGVALVVIYVGAVMVLFLFVVMMLDIDIVGMREGYVRYLPVGLVVAVVMLVEMLMLIGARAKMAEPFPADPALAAGVGNTEWVATELFTRFLLPFETAAVILTVAVIAAVTLTLRPIREGGKKQNPSHQVKVRVADRLRVVQMGSSTPANLHDPVAPDVNPEEGA
ncbi:NADH-quinone oxidoreductase subunit J [Lysobacter ciconiae]|uniref:NADH-quinone oxidoreductase subunit J n=1 Tax=Novilysobacter ciconiae TaxID=2781022 RepID=A0A7S6ZRF1_9GAMM|nr:NADH-quinone oxidoreductase subunit J [Lysobacter ciconiae]QOW18723.1 NADH-quinone oxidoreductase subunit J [Lysobacter ciconiae]